MKVKGINVDDILLDEKSYKNILVYNILWITFLQKNYGCKTIAY